MAFHDPDLTQLRPIFNDRREAAGMTYDQLAEASNLGRQTLLNIAAGRHKGDLMTWLKLSKAFGVGMDELLAPVWIDDGRTDPEV